MKMICTLIGSGTGDVALQCLFSPPLCMEFSILVFRKWVLEPIRLDAFYIRYLPWLRGMRASTYFVVVGASVSARLNVLNMSSYNHLSLRTCYYRQHVGLEYRHYHKCRWCISEADDGSDDDTVLRPQCMLDTHRSHLDIFIRPCDSYTSTPF